MLGRHNVENMLAAIEAWAKFSSETSKLVQAVASFKGIYRRFEHIIQCAGINYIDDYAHHPSEIKALVDGVKVAYPNQYITLIFQPHLFSRTRDFAQGFVHELSKVDELWLMDIYPAREKPIQGISSKMLYDQVQNQKKELLDAEQILQRIRSDKVQKGVLLTVGAGDIDRIVQAIKEEIKKLV